MPLLNPELFKRVGITPPKVRTFRGTTLSQVRWSNLIAKMGPRREKKGWDLTEGREMLGKRKLKN